MDVFFVPIKKSSRAGSFFAVLGLALIASAVLVMPASAGHDPDIAGPPSVLRGVQPTWESGNPTCGNFDSTWTEFKIDQSPADGTYNSLGLTVTVTASDGKFFDWSANLDLAAVFVKGGNGGDLYSYSQAVNSDTVLHAPYMVNTHPEEEKTEARGISHVSFCWAAAAARGSITVVKQTSPADSQSFSLTLNPGDTQAVAGNGGSFTWTTLTAGDYALTEALTAAQTSAGWNLASVSCPGGTTTAATNGVTITLAAGENLTCTFTNTQTVTPASTTTPTPTPTTAVLGVQIQRAAQEVQVLGGQLPRTGPAENRLLVLAAGLAFLIGGSSIITAERRERRARLRLAAHY